MRAYPELGMDLLLQRWKRENTGDVYHGCCLERGATMTTQAFLSLPDYAANGLPI
jgi:hypothetical protein